MVLKDDEYSADVMLRFSCPRKWLLNFPTASCFAAPLHRKRSNFFAWLQCSLEITALSLRLGQDKLILNPISKWEPTFEAFIHIRQHLVTLQLLALWGAGVHAMRVSQSDSLDSAVSLWIGPEVLILGTRLESMAASVECPAALAALQPHRIVGVGRDCWRSYSPVLLLKQGHLEQAAQA